MAEQAFEEEVFDDAGALENGARKAVIGLIRNTPNQVKDP